MLCAQREGSFGEVGLNAALEVRIKRRLSLAERERWYPGRAVMVRQNDYALGLFNGDIGLCLHDGQALRIFFESADGFRTFAPARLPSHDTAFAMTVHKSQGSEFAEVLLVLPEQPSQLLNRALLYTGISRAKNRVEIWALAPRIGEAVGSKAARAAGLALRLRKCAQARLPRHCRKVSWGCSESLQFWVRRAAAIGVLPCGQVGPENNTFIRPDIQASSVSTSGKLMAASRVCRVIRPAIRWLSPPSWRVST